MYTNIPDTAGQGSCSLRRWPQWCGSKEHHTEHGEVQIQVVISDALFSGGDDKVLEVAEPFPNQAPSDVPHAFRVIENT